MVASKGTCRHSCQLQSLSCANDHLPAAGGASAFCGGAAAAGAAAGPGPEAAGADGQGGGQPEAAGHPAAHPHGEPVPLKSWQHTLHTSIKLAVAIISCSLLPQCRRLDGICATHTDLPPCDLQETATTAEQVATAAAAAAAALPKHAAALEALPPAESSSAVEAVKALAAGAAAGHAAIAAAARGDVGKQPQRRRTPAEVAALLEDAAGGPLGASVERSSSAPVALLSANSGACPVHTLAFEHSLQCNLHAEHVSPTHQQALDPASNCVLCGPK
jgi:hypothetical protein